MQWMETSLMDFWIVSVLSSLELTLCETVLVDLSGYAVLGVHSVHCRWQQPSLPPQGDWFTHIFISMKSPTNLPSPPPLPLRCYHQFPSYFSLLLKHWIRPVKRSSTICASFHSLLSHFCSSHFDSSNSLLLSLPLQNIFLCLLVLHFSSLWYCETEAHFQLLLSFVLLFKL